MDNKLIITSHQNCICDFLIHDNDLEQLYIDSCDDIVGNMYIARIKNKVDNLNAAFIEYLPGKIAFLPLNHEQIKTYREGMDIPVQIVKAAVKTKDPVASTELSINGVYCVISEKEGKDPIAFSKKIPEEKRKEIHSHLKEDHDLMEKIEKHHFGVIIRTSARELPAYHVIKEEIKELLHTLKQITQIAPFRTAYTVLYKDAKNYLKQIYKFPIDKIEEIVTDRKEIYEELESSKLPFSIRFYEDEDYPIEKMYSLETKIEQIMNRQVYLKNGGTIVIDETEAMTVIDVNSSKNVRYKKPEQLAFETNMEAAEEIAKQLILRNLSGIIIIDFINMKKDKDVEELESCLKDKLKEDPIECDFVDFTKLGLAELTRKKISPPTHVVLQEHHFNS